MGIFMISLINSINYTIVVKWRMTMSAYGYIYIIENTANGKCYIGQTRGSTEQRLKGHIAESKNEKNTRPLCRAIRKYGEESFIIKPLFTCFDEETMNYMEVFFIDNFGTFGHGGYNATTGGHQCRGTVYSEETRKKIAMKNTGQKRTPEQVEKIRQSQIGKKMSEESKKKIGSYWKGRKRKPEKHDYPRHPNKKTLNTHVLSEETRKRMSEKAKLNIGEKSSSFKTKWLTNGIIDVRVNSDEIEKYITDGWTFGRCKTHKMTDEQKQNLSEKHKGKKISEETKEKMRKAKIGKPRPPHSEETKEKIRRARLKYLAS